MRCPARKCLSSEQRAHNYCLEPQLVDKLRPFLSLSRVLDPASTPILVFCVAVGVARTHSYIGI